MAHPTADKNFRLPETIHPERYDAHLAIDLREKRFSGKQTVQLRVAAPTNEVVLHAVELNVSRAVARLKAGPVEASLPRFPLVLEFFAN